MRREDDGHPGIVEGLQEERHVERGRRHRCFAKKIAALDRGTARSTCSSRSSTPWSSQRMVSVCEFPCKLNSSPLGPVTLPISVGSG